MKVDFIYRFCTPKLENANGDPRRVRFNGEIYFSILLLLKNIEWVNNIYVVYKSVPDYEYIIDNIRKIDPKVKTIKEDELFKLFYKKYGIESISRNSEPIKLCFHLIEDLTEHFISTDDDYFFLKNVSIDKFIDSVNKKIYYKSRKIKGAHQPIMFNKSLYQMYIENMEDEEKKLYIQSDTKRKDIYEKMIPYMIDEYEHLSFNKIKHMFINDSYMVALKKFLGFETFDSLDKMNIFYYWFYNRAKPNLINKLKMIEEENYETVCINDDHSINEEIYNEQINIIHGFLKKQLDLEKLDILDGILNNIDN